MTKGGIDYRSLLAKKDASATLTTTSAEATGTDVEKKLKIAQMELETAKLKAAKEELKMQTLKSRESRKSHKPENVKNKWYKQRWWGDVRKHAASHKKRKHATGTWNSSYWQANDAYYEDPGEDNGWTWEDEFWCSMNNDGAN